MPILPKRRRTHAMMYALYIVIFSVYAGCTHSSIKKLCSQEVGGAMIYVYIHTFFFDKLKLQYP